MCRFVIYHGKRILISDILTKPEHSLISQASRRDAYTPGAEESELYSSTQCTKRNHAVNADGFGLAYYDSVNRRFASLFKSVTPAWSDPNLAELCEVQYTDLMFAHIRAASQGMLVTSQNCHPFRRGQFIFMHNGGIRGFTNIRRTMLASFDDVVFQSIRGSTDSEHAFALFLSQFESEQVAGPEAAPEMRPTGELKRLTPDQFARGVRWTIIKIMEFQKNAGMTYQEAASSLNFAVSDGQVICVSRCRTHAKQDPPTVYYAKSHRKDSPLDLKCRVFTPPHKGKSSSTDPAHLMSENSDCHCKQTNRVVLDSSSGSPSYVISSEPLDYVDGKWELIPKDHMLLVYGDTCQLISLRLPSWDEIGNVMLTPCIRAVQEPTIDDGSPFSLSGSGGGGGGGGGGDGGGNSSKSSSSSSGGRGSKFAPPALQLNSVKKSRSAFGAALGKERRHVRGAFSFGFPASPTNSQKSGRSPTVATTFGDQDDRSNDDTGDSRTAARLRRLSEMSRLKQQEDLRWKQQLRRTVLTSIAVGAACLVMGAVMGAFFGRASSATNNSGDEGGGSTTAREQRADAIINKTRSTSTEDIHVFDSE